MGYKDGNGCGEHASCRGLQVHATTTSTATYPPQHRCGYCAANVAPWRLLFPSMPPVPNYSWMGCTAVLERALEVRDLTKERRDGAWSGLPSSGNMYVSNAVSKPSKLIVSSSAKIGRKAMRHLVSSRFVACG
mmetsp:Transcript_16875/g.51064  ORF Transcript_16875/g.51064 Transcript_16875/m.51064 type:complete len:133 (-) Transcript_16875:155-553(-)|eukprot:scaffold164744_cov35-Tisochrysis_lutea.AAC.1